MTGASSREKQDLQEMYDQKAESYGYLYRKPAGAYYMSRKIDTALILGGFQKGACLLEVGCANGAYTFEFAAQGFKVTGLDLSPECVRYAADKAEATGVDNAEFVAGDAEDLVIFADNTFDGVVSFSALRYVPNPQRAINEIFRVLKPSGVAVIDFPNRMSPWFTLLKPRVTGTTHIHDHQYTTSQVESFLRSAGFQDIQTRRILYTPKFVNHKLLPLFKLTDKVGELPGLNQFASIVMSRGVKP